ncbi:MAG: DUF362 domain-containing protein [Candidatus Eisenbacteria bacterium]
MKSKAKVSNVYLVDLRASMESGVLDRLKTCVRKAGLLKIGREGDLLAVKLHFGEKGCTGYIRTAYVRAVLEAIEPSGCVPFLTDTNTLYVGSRSDSVRHLRTAFEHGFSYGSMGVPAIIADGLKGGSYEPVRIDGKHFDEAMIASDIARADSLLVLTHVKGHELTGIGGALKNLGMGCANRAGKLAMHSDVRPYVSKDRCTGCAKCVEWCPAGAISVKNKKATIDSDVCIGCAECIVVCRFKAIRIDWDMSVSLVQEKIAEYAKGVIRTKKKIGYVNFIMDVSPQCDCYPFSDAAVVPNVGILVSLDPVAIDKASADLINAQPALPGTALKPGKKERDQLKHLYGGLDWEIQIKHAERLGLGTSRYKLIKV